MHSSDAGFATTFRRWSMLIVVVANVGFILDYGRLGTAATISEVMAEFGGGIVPLGFANAIGAAVLVAFLFFFIAALGPRGRRMRIYDKLVVPLALAGVLASCWIVALRHKEVGVSCGLIAASVVVGGVMFARAASASPGRHSRWLRVPFSLYFAAMSLALLGSLSLWLSARGLPAGAGATDEMTAALIAVATVAGGGVAIRYADPVYPAVIALAAGSMLVDRRAFDSWDAPALVACVGMLVVTFLAAAALARRPPHDRAGAASRRRVEKTARRAKAERWYLIEASTTIMRV